MKPVNTGGHSAYQDRVLTQLRKYYPNAATSLSSSTWQILDKFWNLDLSQVDVLMQDRYSVFGPEPRLPSDMLRSILVSVAFKITSYTKLASDLKENHLHAIISGFYVNDTPGIGTFYDFHNPLLEAAGITCEVPQTQDNGSDVTIRPQFGPALVPPNTASGKIIQMPQRKII